MGNNFHILATGLNQDAQKASKKELLQRYQRIYPKEPEPPPGSYQPNGELIPDEDGGNFVWHLFHFSIEVLISNLYEAVEDYLGDT